MRKKKMHIATQSESEGAVGDLKPPDNARLFNHQTNWKYFGRQILCQVRSVKRAGFYYSDIWETIARV